MSEYPIPEDLQELYRKAKNFNAGIAYAIGHLPEQVAQLDRLIERIAKQEAEIERLTEVNTKMREILTSISAVLATIESCTFVNHRLTANEVLEPLQAKILAVLIAARAKEKP